MRIVFSLIAAAALAVGVAVAVADNDESAPQTINPLGLFFNNSFVRFKDYAKPTAMLVTGNCNRFDERFQQARAAGAEVLVYINPTAVYDHLPCRTDWGLYGRDRETVPLWPYPSPGARSSWKNTRMTDIRAGSPWSDHVVEYVANLMREGKFDGVFLDVVGARIWSSTTSWKTWPKQEQDEYTRGNIDLVRRIDAKRREIDPDFIVVNNGYWDRGDKLGFEGEKYVDGVVLEHPTFTELHRKYAGATYSDLGHRRVLVIAREGDASKWAKVPGVTHLSDQKTYGHPNAPVVQFHPLSDRKRRVVRRD
ncbi:MAG TPA: hypothetical protein VFP37_18880 [Steroidobacteraceae bacterium]|nr:hypothetical protein [Steroidobacteraceae bacterium]